MPQLDQTPSKETWHIKAEAGWGKLNLAELIRYRELLFFLAWRDVKVRYKQTFLGATWAILQPFATMVVFSLFFGNLAGIPSDGIPYPIFAYTALVPWTFFAGGLTNSANSLISNAELLKKVYFPRLVIPISGLLAGLVDFVLAFSILLLMMVGYGIAPTVNVIWLPLLLVLALVTSLSVGLWLSAMNVQFRDIKYIVPFLVQLWLFITPVAYPTTLIENEVLRLLYSLNPMVGVIEGFRWALLGVETAPDSSILIGSIVSISLLLSGMLYFNQMERSFADVA